MGVATFAEEKESSKGRIQARVMEILAFKFPTKTFPWNGCGGIPIDSKTLQPEMFYSPLNYYLVTFEAYMA